MGLRYCLAVQISLQFANFFTFSKIFILLKITNSEIILQSDGSLILPKECNAEESDEVEDEDDNENAQQSFPDFNHQIKAATWTW